jgi:3',5'-cyclic AMP phosphodiesterase CpdA
MRIVCVSDTHFVPKDLVTPDGDVLVHAGDLTYNGSTRQIRKVGEWLASLPHKHKVVIAGNHDFGFQQRYAEAREALGDVTYLQDSSCEIDSAKFWGSPWSLRFFDWAFQLDSFNAEAHWAKIPEGTDVLVTHGPPLRILDRTPRGDYVGDQDLLNRVRAVRPRVHVFGHIHDAHGTVEDDGITFVNAAICDEAYQHTWGPVVVDL